MGFHAESWQDALQLQTETVHRILLGLGSGEYLSQRTCGSFPAASSFYLSVMKMSFQKTNVQRLKNRADPDRAGLEAQKMISIISHISKNNEPIDFSEQNLRRPAETGKTLAASCVFLNPPSETCNIKHF